jgi:rhamnose utilization protein RhaD (predicted bifunctional aldolase and dehydrogenase)
VLAKRRKNSFPAESWIMELQKGQYISPEELLKILGLEEVNVDYAFKVMKLKDWIMEVREHYESPVVMRHERHGLRIMPDNEASEYCVQRHTSCIKSMDRYFEKHGWVNRAALSTEERSNHDRDHNTMGLMRQGLIREKRRAKGFDVD